MAKSIPRVSNLSLTSEQVRAARMLLRWEQKDLAEASGVSLPSIKRLETQPASSVRKIAPSKLLCGRSKRPAWCSFRRTVAERDYGSRSGANDQGRCRC